MNILSPGHNFEWISQVALSQKGQQKRCLPFELSAGQRSRLWVPSRRMNEKVIRRLMELSITESERSKGEDDKIHPKVAAVIVDEDGKVISKAHRGERGKGDHAEFVAISKAKEAGFTEFGSATLFATLEPCAHRGPNKTPCARRIVEAGIQRVYIGALDPNPAICGHGELYLRDKIDIVERYPAELVKQIRALNKAFCDLYASSHLPSNSLYIKVRVPDILLTKLKGSGVELDYLPTDEYTLRDLVAYVHGKGSMGRDHAAITKFLMDARAEAFDMKYCDYTYDEDARKIGEKWKKEFTGIMMKCFNIYDYPKRKILNVGFGNGIEGVGLFENCEVFTGVDIAPMSVKKAQARFPRADIRQDAAERLESIEDQSQDIYVSLRTYQSSLFDMDEAVRQAYRVLSPGGVALISIANAYLDKECFIKGCMPHGSKVVDLEHAHRLREHIRHNLTRARFEEIGVHSGRAEEYVYAKKRY